MADAGFFSNGEATVETTLIGGEIPSMASSGEEGEEKNRVKYEQWRWIWRKRFELARDLGIKLGFEAEDV